MKYPVLVAAMVVTAVIGLAVDKAPAQDQAQGQQEEQRDEVITPLGELRRGGYVVVRGEVTRMREYDEFLIEDGSGRAEIEVRGGMRRPTFRAGDTVTVRGWVDDDLIDIPREIYAVEMELADGTVIEVRGDDWD